MQRVTEDNGYKQDSEGNWLPKTDRRSSFETQGDSPYFKGDYAKKDFQTKKFTKKSWWGDTQYESKKYEGDTDGSRFQTASALGGKSAREGTKSVSGMPDRYETGNYATGTAREAGAGRIDRPSDAETDFRRKVYTAPSIIDWREQRSMDMSQTRGILGR